jgi:hypothetical protein
MQICGIGTHSLSGAKECRYAVKQLNDINMPPGNLPTRNETNWMINGAGLKMTRGDEPGYGRNIDRHISLSCPSCPMMLKLVIAFG